MTVKLTDLKIKNLIPEDKKYKVWDAVVSGMYVLVRPSGSRMFVLRVREFNKQKEITRPFLFKKSINFDWKDFKKK